MDPAIEQRGFPRTRSFLRGIVHLGHGEADRDCSVMDYTDHGAKLAVTDPTTVPSVFILHVPLRAATHRARVIWRKMGDVGVAFEKDQADEVTKHLDRLSVQMDEALKLLNDLASRVR